MNKPALIEIRVTDRAGVSHSLQVPPRVFRLALGLIRRRLSPGETMSARIPAGVVIPA